MYRAFEGSKYTPGMTIKDIASAMRKYTKEKYPDCKFSITTKSFSGGSSISLALMESPHVAFVEPSSFTDYSVNHYQIDRNSVLTAPIKEILADVYSELNSYNYDSSDPMTDYFDTNFYVHINIGRWDRPYVVVEGKRSQPMPELPILSEKQEETSLRLSTKPQITPEAVPDEPVTTFEMEM